MSTAAQNVHTVKDAYRIVSPDGRVIAVPREIFEAFDEMLRRRASGAVTMDFCDGRVAGVQQVVKKVYK